MSITIEGLESRVLMSTASNVAAAMRVLHAQGHTLKADLQYAKKVLATDLKSLAFTLKTAGSARTNKPLLAQLTRDARTDQQTVARETTVNVNTLNRTVSKFVSAAVRESRKNNFKNSHLFSQALTDYQAVAQSFVISLESIRGAQGNAVRNDLNVIASTDAGNASVQSKVAALVADDNSGESTYRTAVETEADAASNVVNLFLT